LTTVRTNGASEPVTNETADAAGVDVGVHDAARSTGRATVRPRSSAVRDSTAPVYVISVAAELAGVHPQTLRVYERKGLLDPSRTTGGSRRFSERDLARLRHIQDLTAAGLNLEGVRRVLELESEVLALRDEIERITTEARDTVQRLHRYYRRDVVPFDPSPVPYRAGAYVSATGPSRSQRSPRR
jgi:MerR family transcriptional regulator, heat shock protein HspR